MISIRPIPIPVFPGVEKWITRALVVDEKVVVYLEKFGLPDRVAELDASHIFTYCVLEEGIGGRLIEPVFKDEDDYFNRSRSLSSLVIGIMNDEAFLIERIEQECKQYLKANGAYIRGGGADADPPLHTVEYW